MKKIRISDYTLNICKIIFWQRFKVSALVIVIMSGLLTTQVTYAVLDNKGTEFILAFNPNTANINEIAIEVTLYENFN